MEKVFWGMRMMAQEYSWPQMRGFSGCAQRPIPNVSKPHSIPCPPVCSGRGYSYLCTVDIVIPGLVPRPHLSQGKLSGEPS